MQNHYHRIRLEAFTLFELLIVMSIGLILLLAGVPAYQHLLARSRTANTVNHIIAAIHAARNEAIAQNQIVAFCGSQDGMHCDGQWQAGQMMILDQTQQILRVYAGIPAGDRLWWQSSLGYNNVLKLAPTGFTEGQRGSFYYCPRYNSAQYGAKIIVADSGRVRVETESQELQTACGNVSIGEKNANYFIRSSGRR